MDALVNLFEQTSGLALSFIAVFVLLVWFLPAILALFFNPRHAKLIALACIPAGISFIAWGALMLWATTGKVVDSFRGKVEGPDSPN
ncbi:MAG: hypothetical protein ACJAVV_003423 [Alphaproteobacteria bacterium]|jgi:hypothetical protein